MTSGTDPHANSAPAAAASKPSHAPSTRRSEEELQQAAAARADGNAKRHLAGARRGLRGHQVGDVGAGDHQHQNHEHTQSNQRPAIILLHGGKTCRRGLQYHLLLEPLVDALFGHAGEAFRALHFEGPGDCVQPRAHGFQRGARFQLGQHSSPGGVGPGDGGVHHGGHEQAGYKAGLDTGKWAGTDAYDLVEPLV
jgi:hypothetical protein